MLSEQEKKEMLADARSASRRQDFQNAEKAKPKLPSDLNSYIVFLNGVQKIKPFQHTRVVTQATKNIL